jgi:hypothetical protein
MEVWLEPVLDGTVLHYYLRADSTDAAGRPVPLPPRKAAREVARRQRAAKAIGLALKDRLEAGRAPGEPPPGSPPATIHRPPTSAPPPPPPPGHASEPGVNGSEHGT